VCRLSIRVSPRQLVFESRGAWLGSRAIESGRWGAGWESAHGGAFISAGAWGVWWSGLGGSQGGVCPFVDVIARQNGSVVFVGGFGVGEGWLEGLVSVYFFSRADVLE
jgi:hypothetical protein